ncbi:MAG TPA: helix-hairpin-helix domain-containing protein, partial [Methylotenera sp.]|nr:helix-hairpin-helix domain-containing protein [Methylotenera sp.]
MKKMLLAFIAFLSFSLSAFAAVNINTATQTELETLENVGETRAKAIIEYRNKNGKFKSLDELDKVPGIGEKTLESIKKDGTISGATTVTAPNKNTKNEKPMKEKATKAEKAVATDKPAKAEKASKEAKSASKEDSVKADKAAKDKEKADKAAAKEAEKEAKKA